MNNLYKIKSDKVEKEDHKNEMDESALDLTYQVTEWEIHDKGKP